MPFKSLAQQKFMFARHPAMAREWASEMTSEDFDKLPYKVGEDAMQEAVKRKRKKKEKK